MAKKSKELIAYQQGLTKALELVEKGGADELRREIEFRNIGNTPIAIDRHVIEEWQLKLQHTITESVTYLLLNAVADEIGLGAKRIEKCLRRFESYAENIYKGYVDWEGIVDCVTEEKGVTRERIAKIYNKDIEPAEGVKAYGESIHN